MAHQDLFHYQARIERIVDGDTYDVVIDIGFKLSKEIRIRLNDVNTAETYGVKKESEKYQNGIAHKTFVEEWLHKAEADSEHEFPVLMRTHKHEKGKYGRYVADVVRRSDGAVLSEDLLEEFDTVEKVDY